MRLEPESRATRRTCPSKLGIYAAAAHLGWFQDTFKAAYPAGETATPPTRGRSSTASSRTASSMPKGNHPRLDAGRVRHRRRVVRARPAATDHVHRGRTPARRRARRSITLGGRRRTSTRWRRRAGRGQPRQRASRMFGCGSATRPAAVPHRAARRVEQVVRHRLGERSASSASSASSRSTRTTGCAARPTVASSRTARTGGDGAVISDLQAEQGHARQGGVRPGLLPGQPRLGVPGHADRRRLLHDGRCSTSNPDRIDFSRARVQHGRRRQPLPAPRRGPRRRRLLRHQQPVHERQPVAARSTRDPSAAFGADRAR